MNLQSNQLTGPRTQKGPRSEPARSRIDRHRPVDRRFDASIDNCIRQVKSPMSTDAERRAALEQLVKSCLARDGLNRFVSRLKMSRIERAKVWATAAVSRRKIRAKDLAMRFEHDLAVKDTYPGTPGEPRFAWLTGRRLWRTFLFEWIGGVLAVAFATGAFLQDHQELAVASGTVALTLIACVFIRRASTQFRFFDHSILEISNLWPATKNEQELIRECTLYRGYGWRSWLLALANSDYFIIKRSDGRFWTVTGLTSRKRMRDILTSLQQQTESDRKWRTETQRVAR